MCPHPQHDVCSDEYAHAEVSAFALKRAGAKLLGFCREGFCPSLVGSAVVFGVESIFICCIDKSFSDFWQLQRSSDYLKKKRKRKILILFNTQGSWILTSVISSLNTLFLWSTFLTGRYCLEHYWRQWNKILGYDLCPPTFFSYLPRTESYSLDFSVSMYRTALPAYS